MKILKEGKIPRTTIKLEKFRHQCTNCKTLFQYDFADIKLLAFIEIAIVCPLCHKAIIVVDSSRRNPSRTEYQQEIWDKFMIYYNNLANLE